MELDEVTGTLDLKKSNALYDEFCKYMGGNMTIEVLQSKVTKEKLIEMFENGVDLSDSRERGYKEFLLRLYEAKWQFRPIPYETLALAASYNNLEEVMNGYWAL